MDRPPAKEIGSDYERFGVFPQDAFFPHSLGHTIDIECVGGVTGLPEGLGAIK